MTTTLDCLLTRLEWQVLRRLDGRLQGAYRTTYRGSGVDFVGLRDYGESDDARHIDWNATARLPVPQVRQFTEDREVTAWLVLDRTASMALGKPGTGKHDVLAQYSLLLARLFARGGNKVGAVLYDGHTTQVVTPASGRNQALRIGYELERTKAPLTGEKRSRKHNRGTHDSGKHQPAGGTDLAAVFTALDKLARRRCVVIIVSDFIGAGLDFPASGEATWERALLRLTMRHEVVALRMSDRADDELPTVGLVLVQDAESGEQVLVDTADPLFRARLAAAVDAREVALDQAMRRVGVPLHNVDTAGDPVDTLVRIVSLSRPSRIVRSRGETLELHDSAMGVRR